MRTQTRIRQTESERGRQERYAESARKRGMQEEDGGWKQQREREQLRMT